MADREVKIIAVLAGDGIGPEVMKEALRVLDAVSKRNDCEFEIREGLIGGAAFDEYQEHFPQATLNLCKESDAILFGSVGGPVSELDKPKWKNCEINALLGIRKAFSFNVNLRPVRVLPELSKLSPLSAEIVKQGVDILFVRELVGGIYFGEKKRFVRDGMRVASDLCEYSEEQIASVSHAAFKAATKRRKKVCSVDKANVLTTSKLWREVVNEVSKDYPEIELEHMLVDNCAMQLVRTPSQFDVILTENLFGDILSDAGAVLPGSLGLLSSASINQDGFGLYEPPGGSAQDIVGKDLANPIAQILSLAMLLRFSFGYQEEANAIELAVTKTLRDGLRTADIAAGGEKTVSTSEMADRVLSYLAF